MADLWVLNRELRIWSDEVIERLGLQNFWVQYRNGHLVVELLRVREKDRGQGRGTAAMYELFKLADEQQLPIRLTPGRVDWDTPRLIAWYQRLGFTLQEDGDMTREYTHG